MRALIVAGMMVAAGSAGAADFGVSVEKFKASMLANRELGLKDNGCKPEFCYLAGEGAMRWVAAQRDSSNVVTVVIFELPSKEWAESAIVLDAIQSSLLIDPGRGVRSAEVTKTGRILPGIPLTFSAPGIKCSVGLIVDKPDVLRGACAPG